MTELSLTGRDECDQVVMNTLWRAGVSLATLSIQFRDGRLALLRGDWTVLDDRYGELLYHPEWVSPIALLRQGTPLSHQYPMCEAKYVRDGNSFVAEGGEGTQGDWGYVAVSKAGDGEAANEQLWLAFFAGLNPVASLVVDEDRLIANTTSNAKIVIPIDNPAEMTITIEEGRD
jgi:hypothetical protein